jgi:putative membrane protein
VSRNEPALLLAVVAIVFVALGIAPKADRVTWLLENLPVLVAAPLLVATRRRFPLTPLAYRLMFVHALILMVGGHWTYERVPLGNWARDAFGLARNPYDRLGHFVQGFVPAILAREVLRRTSPLRGRWLAFLVVCTCLAISAAYELFEWLAAVALGQGADAFLGTQGDPWDTQKDMALALAGAVLALALLSRVHERQLARLSSPAARRDLA